MRGPATIETTVFLIPSRSQEADGNLIKSLKKELEFEKEEGGAENPESPPNEFQMAESEGDSMLRWTRKVGAETIEVEACVSDEDELYDDDFEAIWLRRGSAPVAAGLSPSQHTSACRLRRPIARLLRLRRRRTRRRATRRTCPWRRTPSW